MICTVWSAANGGPAGRDVFYRHERDLDRLLLTEASRTASVREAFHLRPSARGRDERASAIRDSIRARIATLRAIRFVLEVLT